MEAAGRAARRRVYEKGGGEMKLFVFAALVLAAVTTLAVGAGASQQTADSEMLMMAVMGGGIEDGSDGTGARSASAMGVFSTNSARAGGFRSIDVPGATATRAFGINAAG